MILHFTIGPVQEFVAQARRTRDFWAGSFLLSYLSGQAMLAILDTGGRIVFPQVHDSTLIPTDPLLKAIKEPKAVTSANAPRIATLPNRFMATFEKLDEKDIGQIARKARQAVRAAWKTIAKAVWREYIQPACIASKADLDEVWIIWERQTRGFWDIAWVVAGADQDSGILDRRKNWRSHLPTVEAGEQCVIMSGWQELSGRVGIHTIDRERQQSFWATLQEVVGDFNLRKGERLCAVALVKRLFPLVSEDALGWEVSMEGWPSTPYMAAVPFLERCMRDAPDAAKTYAQLVAELYPIKKSALSTGGFGETKTDIKALHEYAGKLKGIDGDLLYDFAIRESSSSTSELGPKKPLEGAPDLRGKFVEGLKKLTDAVKLTPSPFYALLRMDGDNMGALLANNPEYQERISTALAIFSMGVAATVYDYDGVTIYAGGDDVLALLPIDRVMAAAGYLEDSYRQAFGKALSGKTLRLKDGPANPSISAALVMAHFNDPLLEVIELSGKLLDERAKGLPGKNAACVGVLKGGVPHVLWTQKWSDVGSLLIFIDKLGGMGDPERQFSSSFLQRVHDMLLRLHDRPREAPGTILRSGLDLKEMLMAEYMRSREAWPEDSSGQKMTWPQKRKLAEENIESLFAVCGALEESDGQSLFVPDGMLLARFLLDNQMREELT